MIRYCVLFLDNLLWMKAIKIYLLVSAGFLISFATWSQAIVDISLESELTSNQLSQSLQFPVLHGVRNYRVTYSTPGIDGQPDTASGLIVLPTNTEATGIVVYQHGTSNGRQDVPSNLNNEALLVMAFAGQGYISCAPDYLGLGTSRGFHPYVHAATEASAGVDLLIATMGFAADQGFESVQHIFVTGYSQGGHAAMALSQALHERPTDDLWLTAGAPMSGPYSLSDVMNDRMIEGMIEYDFPDYVVYNLLGYQEFYGNIYSSLDSVFKEGYVDQILAFSKEEISLSALRNFLVDQLERDFGNTIPINMFREDFVQELRADSLHPYHIALRENDTYLWTPDVPLRMYYCGADEQVPFENSLVAEREMKARGASDVEAIELDPNANHGGCVPPAVIATIGFFNTFRTTGVGTGVTMESISVHPNPTNGFVDIQISNGKTIDLVLTNLLGQIILRAKHEAQPSLNLSSLRNGIYLLHFQDVDGNRGAHKIYLNK